MTRALVRAPIHRHGTAVGSTGAAVVIATHDRRLRRDTVSWEQLDLRPGTSTARIVERSAAGGA
ncbi:hypothetical protein [Nocardiopsis tropica]|uniref:Uncharacterized protein n=1 Tax=Nocardiopsis tropica TaxID=109330 RepID=A0ABU7KZY8_9ACTN|nr:hypothetical protein [Nocardiopsis umidischolae]MEE2054207.1 hypothetical protein [Nocardiopsis umidischolae]